jgi:hypothetical protein
MAFNQNFIKHVQLLLAVRLAGDVHGVAVSMAAYINGYHGKPPCLNASKEAKEAPRAYRIEITSKSEPGMGRSQPKTGQKHAVIELESSSDDKNASSGQLKQWKLKVFEGLIFHSHRSRQKHFNSKLARL